MSIFKAADYLTKKKSIIIGKILRAVMYLLLLDLCVVFMYPFLYMLITSVKSPVDVNDSTITWVINEFYFHNYEIAFEGLKYIPSLMKSVLYCLITTVGHVFVCSFVGYGFARYDFKGKKLFFMLLILSMVIPVQTIIIPQYLLYSGLGMTNGFGPLIIPTFFGYGLRGALFIFLFRQFYLSLPVSLEEAAAVDGCTPVKTFFRIALPASTSSVVVSIVLSIVWHWNEFYEPGIYLTKSSQKLLPMLLPGLYSSITQTGDMSEALISGGEVDIYTAGVAMAGTFLVVLPVLIFYFIIQKQFRQGIETSGITGE